MTDFKIREGITENQAIPEIQRLTELRQLMEDLVRYPEYVVTKVEESEEIRRAKELLRAMGHPLAPVDLPENSDAGQGQQGGPRVIEEEGDHEQFCTTCYDPASPYGLVRLCSAHRHDKLRPMSEAPRDPETWILARVRFTGEPVAIRPYPGSTAIWVALSGEHQRRYCSSILSGWMPLPAALRPKAASEDR